MCAYICVYIYIYIYAHMHIRIWHSMTLKRLICDKTQPTNQPKHMRLQILYIIYICKKALALNNL